MPDMRASNVLKYKNKMIFCECECWMPPTGTEIAVVILPSEQANLTVCNWCSNRLFQCYCLASRMVCSCGKAVIDPVLELKETSPPVLILVLSDYHQVYSHMGKLQQVTLVAAWQKEDFIMCSVAAILQLFVEEKEHSVFFVFVFN